MHKNRISRHGSIVKATAWGLVTAITPEIFSSPSEAASPKKSDRLRIRLDTGYITDSLDPAVITDFTMMVVTRGLLRNNLVELDYKDNLVPELAKSWEASPNATRWTLNLRKGVEFHDGKPFEAADAQFTINHRLKENRTSSTKGLSKSTKEIKTDGKLTIVFTLESGNADFPYYITD